MTTQRAGAGNAARRALLAAAAGALLYAAHPPLDAGALGAVALAPLFALARDAAGARSPWRSGFGWGLLAGLVFLFPLLSWIGRFGLLAWTLLSLTEALAVATATAVLAAWGGRPWRPAVGVVAWVGAEALRGAVPFGGFPWGVLGYTQHGGGPFLPAARVVGVLGVSALLAGTAAALEAGLAQRPWRAGPRSLAGPVTALAAVAVVIGALGRVPPPPATGATIDVAAVQGNDVELPPILDRGNVERVEDIAQRMATVTRRLAGDPPAAAVWPENALDADPHHNPALAAAVAEALAVLDGGTLLAGTLLEGPRPDTFVNAVVQYGPGGELVDRYVKRQLVPFGEYVPLRPLLGGFGPLRAIPRDGVAGDSPGVFTVDGAAVGPVTCFESIFPRLVRDQVQAGAQVLVVTTNNASFGRTPASRQHLAFSQLRAVETGRWTLHAGISGISAIVSPTGSTSQETALFERAIVRADLPLVDAYTPYMRVGELVGDAALVLSAVVVVVIGMTGRPRRGRHGRGE